MAGDSRSLLREWVLRWKRVGPVLEEIHREGLQNISTSQALQNLAGAFESARLHFSPAKSSGLVTQQKLFRALRK